MKLAMDVRIADGEIMKLQYYANSSENLFFKDGKLVIRAKKESYVGVKLILLQE